MKLQIAQNLSLPLEAVTQSLAILARKRAGKSYLARGFAEQLLKAEQQVVIIDPKGDWWGIRSASDGKHPGFPVVVLGGEHGDLPLEKTASETVARLIVEERVSVLLDLSDFRKSEVPFFLGGDIKQRHDGLLEIMYRLKAKEEFRTPVMLIVDEADAIAPQKPYPGEERMLGALEDIVRRGGQRGIGSMLISQRSAVVNKNVLTQTQVMIAMRMIAEQDLDAIMGWVDVHGLPEQAKILKASLPALPTGDAWFLSPGWPSQDGIFQRIHGNLITTFDSGATPKAGEKRIKPKNLADVDMGALQRRMAETIERAKAVDPKEWQKQKVELQKRIAELDRAGAKSPAPAKPDPAAAKASHQEALERATLRGAAQVRRQVAKEFGALVGPVRKAMHQAITTLRTIAADLERTVPPDNISLSTVDLPAEPEPPAARTMPPRIERPVRQAPAPRKRAEGDDAISRPQQAILDGLAWLEVIGIDRAARNIAGFMAGASPRSSAFMNNLGALRTSNLIDYPAQGMVALTDAGREVAHRPAVPPSSEHLHQMIYERLPRPQAAILEALIEAYPKSLSRQETADQAGASVTSSAFMNNLGALRSIGLIDYPAQGQVAALPLLFL